MRSIWCLDGRLTWIGKLYSQSLLLLCPRMAHRRPKENNADEGIKNVEHQAVLRCQIQSG